MTSSSDSSLFGNNDDLYSRKRHHDEVEPLTQVAPQTQEPLFPASPAAPDRSWMDSMPASIVYEHKPSGPGYGDNGNGNNGNANNGNSNNGNASIYGTVEPKVEEATFLYAPSPVLPSPASPAEPFAMRREEPSIYPNSKSQAAPVFEFVPQLPQDGYPVAYLSTEPSPTVLPKPVLSAKEMAYNRQFAMLLDMMQHGAWPQALEKIQAMRAEYPGVASLNALLDEATLKTELMEQWTHKIKGRRLTVGQEWLIRRSLPFLLLLALFVSGVVFYRNFVAPSRQVVAMERANQALVDEATGLLQIGQIYEAIELYNLVLARDPNNASAKQGVSDANRLAGLAVTYDIAIRVANSGNLERSLNLLQSVKTKSPAFRDIDARLARVQSLLDAEQVYRLAEKSFAQRRWVEAITHYEQTQLLASDYQAVRVGIQLSAAYFMASQKLMTQWPAPEFGTDQIRSFLRKAQTTNGQNESITTFLAKLDDFMEGERALNNNDLEQAVSLWRDLYEQEPGFLGGYLAEQLYRAYLALASEVRAANPNYARELLTMAAAMPVNDSSEARSQLQNLGLAAPAAQPTPTAIPTLAYVAPVAVAPAAPAETPTPEPTPTPANTYQGWIAFRSTRDGTEKVYVMRSDGSEQQLAPDDVRSRLDGLYQEERRAPDGRVVYVQSPAGRSDANIYVTSGDGLNVNTLTDNNRDEYDPVWSSGGDRIAFVSNSSGNDEIWVMRADGAEQRQLTANNWEWDKHPTWSPDGSQIAFFSNRSGQRQIWVMSGDGSGQRNLSSNNYDDWDPVWLK